MYPTPTHAFLHRVFEGLPGYIALSIMAKAAPHTYYFGTSAAEIARCVMFAAKNAPDHNVYVGIATRDKEYARFTRGSLNQLVALPGVWADIDIANPLLAVHRAHALPTSEPEAMSILDDCALPEPSIIVRTGYGLHVYYLFDKPITFEPGYCLDAQKLAREFQGLLIAAAARRGWHLDNTSDLTRMLRLPGTLNHKLWGQPQPVSMITL